MISVVRKLITSSILEIECSSKRGVYAPTAGEPLETVTSEKTLRRTMLRWVESEM